MSLRSTAYQNVSNLYFRIRGYHVARTARFLEESQWWSAERIQEFQNKSIRKLISYVYARVPHYGRIMEEQGLTPEDFRTTEDLVKFPILTKEGLRSNWNQLISTQTSSFKTSIRNTGGSTGEPLRIVIDDCCSAWENAAFRRGLGFAGYRFGEPTVKLFGGTLGLKPEKFVKKLQNKFCGVVFLAAFEISDSALSDYVEKIRHSRAKFLRGYTSAIYLLAKLTDERKLRLSMQGVFPTAEKLYDFQRRTIEKAFQCEVFDQYGCGESNSIANECRSHEGLHVSDEHVFLEALKETERVSEGEMGALTLTTLRNYAMPLIRYQNGDVISLGRKPCSCGRGLSRITRIYGRTNDLLLARDGRLISGSFIPHLFRDTEGIKQVQVIQEAEDVIHLKLVQTPKFAESELQRLFQALRRYLGDVRIEVEFVPFIAKTSQGKLKFVISKFGHRLLCQEDEICPPTRGMVKKS